VRPPILYLTVAFALGLGAALHPSAVSGARYAGPAVLLGAAVLWRRAPLGAALGVMAVAGAVWGAAAVREQEATCAGRWARLTPGRHPRVSSAIVRLLDPMPATGGIADGVVQGGPCGGALRIRWPESHPARGGTEWVVAGRWLGDARRGILAARHVRLLDPDPRGRGKLRDGVAARSRELFGARAPLVDALVIGRRGELDVELRDRYSRSGLAHLLSISGLHVGFFAAWLAVLLARLRLAPRWRFVASTVVILAYVWLLGFPAPATRSAAMLVLAEVARLRQRLVAPRGLIALGALFVLLVDPWALLSVGAWLSVAAVAAVIWGARATERSPTVVRLLAPAAAATLLTAPITALTFGTVAPIGVAANLLAIPLAGVAVPGLLVALVLSSDLLAAGSGLCLALLDLIAKWAADIPGGHVVTTAGWEAAAVWLAVLAAGWWLWNTPRRRWLFIGRVALIGAVLSWSASYGVLRRLSQCHCLTVHFLDVGQGDAALLRTPAGRWILIDAGPGGQGRDAGKRVVVPFLRREGARRIELVVASHGHADHVGGMAAVLEAMPVGLVLEPGEPIGEAPYLGFLAGVEGAGARWQAARAGDRIELDGVRLVVLSPDAQWTAAMMDPNEESVVLLVEYGGARLVFTGDAGEPVERRLAGRVGDVDLLKIGHHGSRSATSDAWLDELRPERAVISLGAKNRYGHPAAEVLERLAARGIAVLRTDRRGTITFTIDEDRAYTDVGHHD
jgi:competence protein ComEC